MRFPSQSLLVRSCVRAVLMCGIVLNISPLCRLPQSHLVELAIWRIRQCLGSPGIALSSLHLLTHSLPAGAKAPALLHFDINVSLAIKMSNALANQGHDELIWDRSF